MDRIVSNATPLIYLAKANRLNLLQALIKETLIPQSVHQEVVINGKQLGEKDAFLVDKAISQGWILVRSSKKMYNAQIELHPGEAEVISLAKESGIEIVLMDDSKGRIASEMAGLRPRGTLWLLLKAVKANILNLDQFLATLENITRAGFYLKEEVYLKAVREARKLTEVS